MARREIVDVGKTWSNAAAVNIATSYSLLLLMGREKDTESHDLKYCNQGLFRLPTPSSLISSQSRRPYMCSAVRGRGKDFWSRGSRMMRALASMLRVPFAFKAALRMAMSSACIHAMTKLWESVLP